MKTNLVYVLCFAFITVTTSCRAQLMQNLNDAHKIADNKNQFIGKPLKYLLREIKPDIKMVIPGEGNNYKPSSFSFLFITKKQYEEYSTKKATPLTIKVMVKENFKWDWKERSAQEKKEFLWTKADDKKYGDLTIVYINVYGSN
ncbi:hypothetical protein [Arachidicoccus ginsenosidimutans]|uniref:hypothetical protein n=1 Tax=Arachidicoccus sp. BS20 TaxID=1850526 RepID=UPI0012E94EE6|nr:hypothetical protein [Arachidicoccus sp. BS20]